MPADVASAKGDAAAGRTAGPHPAVEGPAEVTATQPEPAAPGPDSAIPEHTTAGQVAPDLAKLPEPATPALRILQADAVSVAAERWEHGLEGAARLGFGHVLLAPVFAPGQRGERSVPADLQRLHPALGDEPAEAWLRRAAAASASHKLGLLLDLRIDRVAAGSTLAAAQQGLFAPPDEDALLDPRRDVDVNACRARLDAPGQAEALGAWWGQHLAAWHALGVAGFRLLGLADLPGDAVATLLRALRRGCPGALLLAWTPGLPWPVLEGLAGIGLDGVFCSLPWWDGEGAWLWEEIARLRGVAPVLAPTAPLDGEAAAPPETAVPHEPAQRAAASRRLALAALAGDGWLVGGIAAPGGAGAAVPGTMGGPGDGLGPAALNRLLEAGLPAGGSVLLSGSGGPVLALLRTNTLDARFARRGVLVLANTDLTARHPADPSLLLSATRGALGRFAPLLPADGEAFVPDHALALAPGEVRLYAAEAAVRPDATAALDGRLAREAGGWGRLALENPSPAVDGGEFPVRRIAGELLTVEVDVVCDGHDTLAVALQWRGPDEEPHELRMRPLGNDRFQAAFPLPGLGRYRYRVEAWRDVFGSFRDELGKKHAAGVPIELEMIEGTRLVEAAAAGAEGALQGALQSALDAMQEGPEARRTQLLSPALAEAMMRADQRPGLVASERPVAVQAERLGARYASWYEVFPRSMSDDATRHGTFADVERHLPRVRGMGFDVLYFPPIHPIGRANRKGRNNTLTPGPEDVGSPYAIGSEDGGHDALHPELGTLEDFRHLVAAAQAQGIEVAIDFAVQCSPDHPWLKQHRGWFDWRPDGSIKYAENPPKKYQDIVNVDFYAPDAVPGLWLALCEVVLFWARQGVRLFRVDNPHTKPLPFWEWMIAEVQRRFPDAIFLAEAFTRPKVMYRLAKVGFSQSYTYFTWRNSKRELEEYLTELSTTAPREFFRPHFFVNTPDINPPFLQTSGRPGHLIRAALAATLSGLWGVYSGFELCEATPLPGREEYLDSEKYEIRAWDWERPGNIVPEITRLNAIRANNPALQTHLGVFFCVARNDAVMLFEKATPDRSNVVLVAISMDPAQPQEAEVELPLWRWSLPDSATLALEDLVQGGRFTWSGRYQRIRLTPEQPYAIWRARPA